MSENTAELVMEAAGRQVVEFAGQVAEVAGQVAEVAGQVTEGTGQAANAVHHVHTIWMVMTVIGVAGGLLSWKRDVSDTATDTDELLTHVITGLLAVFMVPLFLQMIGSTLLSKLSPDYHEFYVFIGFCSAAGYIAHNFASRVSARMMQDTKRTAQGADSKADEALKKANEGRLEALKTTCGVLFESGEYERALIHIEEALDSLPKDVSLLWKKAYIVKRLKDDTQQAHELVDRAVRLSQKPMALLYFNRACYAALLGRSVKEVTDDLDEVIRHGGIEKARGYVKDDLDGDFKALMQEEKFKAYLTEKGLIDT